jgi:lipopolysaccharide transport system permease protein
MSYVNIQDRRLPFALRYAADFLSYRHLCWNLVGSALRSRFRRTHLGVLWAVLQPLAFSLMIATVWGGLHGKASVWELAAYVFCGTVAFELFGTSVQNGQDALMSASGFIRQARIPFLIFQLRVVLTSLVMFMFALVGALLVSGIVTQGANLGPPLLLIPAFMGIALLFMLPLVIIMSIIGALFRDVKYISLLVERALFLISPVMLPREILQQPHLRFLEVLNPLVSFLDLFRDPVLYGRLWEAQDVIVMFIWIALLWVVAIFASMSVGRKIVFAI